MCDSIREQLFILVEGQDVRLPLKKEKKIVWTTPFFPCIERPSPRTRMASSIGSFTKGSVIGLFDSKVHRASGHMIVLGP